MKPLAQIAHLLSADAAFRQAFALDPEKAVAARGLTLDADAQAALSGAQGLLTLSPRELEWCGRLTEPLYAGPDDTHYRGYFTHNSKNKVADAKDGSSTTIMFIESAGGAISADNVNYTWTHMLWAAAQLYSQFGACPDHTNPNCNFTQSLGLFPNIPGSLHANNMMMTAFGDGSVRMIRPDLDFGTVWVPLCGMSDGDVVSFSSSGG